MSSTGVYDRGVTDRTKGTLLIALATAGVGGLVYALTRRSTRTLGDVAPGDRQRGDALVRAAGDYNAERRRQLADLRRWRDGAVAAVRGKARAMNRAKDRLLDACERAEDRCDEDLRERAFELAVDPDLTDAPADRELDELVADWLGPDKTDAADDLVEALR